MGGKLFRLKKGKKITKKTRACVGVGVFYSRAKGLGWSTEQRVASQGSLLKLSEGVTGVTDKQNFTGNQEK